MCYIKLEPCDVWVEQEVKSRKQHLCDCCGGLITPGEKYTKHFSKFEGEITSEKICIPCDVDRSEFAEAHEHIRPAPGGTKEMIKECLHEREDFKQMLKWARILKRMDKRRQPTTPGAAHE